MDAFLAWLEKYDLLIELIITVLTISLSLLALFQTKIISKRQLKQEENIAQQQADLQERQLKISVYEQKNEINKTLNLVFHSIGKMSLIFTTLKTENFSQSKLYQLLNGLVDGINPENVFYVLEQSRFFMHDETASNIRTIGAFFLEITTSIECLDLLDEDEKVKKTIVKEVQNVCAAIKALQPSVESAMLDELKLE